VSLANVKLETPGKKVMLTGNEAVARGAIEAGMKYAASYPGSPTSEVLDILGSVTAQFGLYVEWSTNEKIASEAAAAASFAGVRSLTIMKPDGMNVALDFLTSLAYSGVNAGMVIMVGDDPSAHSSIKEEDSRHLSKLSRLPILEPFNSQEAKDLTSKAFELSEALRLPVVVRLVTRVCHATSLVNLGETEHVKGAIKAAYNEPILCRPQVHPDLEEKIFKIAQWASQQEMWQYFGPEDADSLVIASGPCTLYAKEALEILGLQDKMGVLSLKMTWPLPEQGLINLLANRKEIIFAEEIDPFIEENITSFAAYHTDQLGVIKFYGKRNGYVKGPLGAGIGELNTDIMIDSIAEIKGLERPDFCGSTAQCLSAVGGSLPERDRAFCPGCPHRASYWVLKSALALEGNDGFVLGDIGCYAMGRGRTGYYTVKSVHSMGSGIGLAHGFGTLQNFDFTQPIIAVVGDSTFYHAVVPALINAKHNNGQFLCVILDNSTTAMTGHQPHPGTAVNALGLEVPAMNMENMISGLGIKVEVADPYDINASRDHVLELLTQSGPKVLILRRECSLVVSKKEKPRRVTVNQEKCIGKDCGCNNLCSRAFGCPANIIDLETGKGRIDEALCVGCGVCASLCPAGAITVEEGV